MAISQTVTEAVTEPTTDPTTCPECGGRPRPDGIERTCEACGLVVATEAIDRGPPWRVHDASERDRIHAAPVDPTRQGKHLGSQIGTASERAAHPRLRRQARLHDRATTRSHRERNHRYAAGEIERIASACEAGGSVADTAKRLYRQLTEARSLEGYDLDTLAAACVYTALRVAQRGVTADAVAAVARSEAAPAVLERRHTWLVRELGVPVPPPSVAARVRAVGADLGVGEAAVQRALSRLEEIDEADVARGSPSTLAAGLLWRVSEATQAEAAEAAGVTPTGVRKRLEAVEGDD